MIFLKTLFIVIELVSCLLLICIILLQKSKSEGLGLAFGAGAGESLFGARAGNVLSKATVVLGIVFLANTLVLGILFAQKDKGLMDDVTAPAVQAIEATELVIPTETPVLEIPEETVEIDVEVEEEM
jgi:preprotein translocase subunit SecG